ncbi:MAG: HAD family phosphatase [bacterium]|nr:HAD family phosphatase [bacterium]
MSLLLPESLQREFKGILFDLDGTLLESERLHYNAFVQAMEEFGYNFEEIAKNFPVEGNFRELFRKVAGKLKFSDEQYETIYERKMEITLTTPAGEIDKIDGVFSFLEYIFETGIPMGVVTNSDREYAENTLSIHDMSQYFSELITANDLLNPKPAPDGYLKGAELLNVNPNDIIVFENTDTGISAAKAAGMSVIAIRFTDVSGTSTYDEADHAVDSFADSSIDELRWVSLGV